MILSPQSQSVYRILLNSNRPLSAKELALKLQIFPNTVYRLINELDDVGLVAKTNNYPSQFTAKSINEGLSLFLLYQTNWFSKQFSNKNKKERISNAQDIEFSFIQSRDELMRESAREINKAKKSIDLLRSGHEIPADVMLATIEAKRRGVVTRMLIQDYNKDNAKQVALWKKNGILVRKTPLAYIRLMIYDSTTIYFMSYKHTDSQRDMGMKIVYPPFAAVLSQLFQGWWQKAEKFYPAPFTA